GQVAWRATVPGDASVPPEAQILMAPHRHLVTYPLRGGALRNIVAVQERADWVAEGWAHRDDPANLRRAFDDFTGEARALIDAVDDVYLWGLFRHPVALCWHGPGVAILGDAAHPTLPFLAQGGNLALEDAWVLADCLGNGNGPDALARYQARRRDRAQRVISAANRNAWKYHVGFGPARWIGHSALSVLGQVAPGRMVRQFDWVYRHDVTRGD
ncbi:MAG: FAD-dependent monooxygenase, partial [Marinibacterium sp.]|nr:FAD-dependent monooxygenase [Marinibacterium sp.]